MRAAPVRVSDRPRWSYRGLLIDTARHWMPLSLLRQHLDAMAYSKLNAFHWHHHDSGVWSLESTSIPGLARAAAAPGWQYSHAEVQALVVYARDRGIRVIPEFGKKDSRCCTTSECHMVLLTSRTSSALSPVLGCALPLLTHSQRARGMRTPCTKCGQRWAPFAMRTTCERCRSKI